MKATEFIQVASNGDLTIPNVNVVDVINGVIKYAVTIHISKGVIGEISENGEHQKFTKQGNNKTELWAIPGLIDSHVHLFEIHEGEDRGKLDKSESFNLAKNRALANIREALKVGVTCVRDVGAFSAYNNQLRDMIELDIREFTFRIVSCGNHITTKNGHFFDRGFVCDPNESSLEAVVLNELQTGTDFIKVMNDDPIFDLCELQIIAAACKKMKRKFSCHASTKETIDLAFNAGADTIEHAACYSEEFCNKVIQKGVFICPTFVSALDSVNHIDDVLKVFKDCKKEDFVNWAEFLRQNLPKTFKAGVKVIAGTDAGTFPTNFQSLPREIIEFTKLGATNLQALQSATILAAEALDIAAITGSLEVNKSADLVLLGKDPIDNLEEAIRDIKMVVSRGHIVINTLRTNYDH